MITRNSGRLAAMVSALMLTTTFAVAQIAPPPSTPPAATAPSVGSGAGTTVEPQRRGGRERTEGRAAMGACRADVQTLCGTVERGKGKKLACLIENRAKASSACQTAITAVETARAGKVVDKAAKKAAKRADGGKRGGKMAVCKADSKALCADVERGGGRKVACLKANEAKLTPDCAAVVKTLPSKT